MKITFPVFVSTLLISTTAIAASVPLAGTLSAPPIFSGYGDEQAGTMISFGCEDETMGKFDMCIDTSVSLTRNNANIAMAMELADTYKSRYPKIIFRTGLSVDGYTDDANPRVANVYAAGNTMPVQVQVPTGETMFIKMTSVDGGTTWTPPVTGIDKPDLSELDM